MRARNVFLLLLVLTVVPVANAAEVGTALNTKLSEPVLFASPYRNDPPGTWYGDKSLPGDDEATVQASACPAAADGSARPVTGSVTTGYGWSSHGNSRYNAASVNYCKETVDEDGDGRVFNLHLDVGRYDGPGMPMGRGGPMGPRGHGPALPR